MILLILDCPYNLTKTFGAGSFREKSSPEYERWFESWFVRLLPALKTTSSLYVCGDWKCSAAIYNVLDRACDHSEPHYLGAGERARGKRQLEERKRGCLVRHIFGPVRF